ncbi:MAG TPA: hypothetical protein PKM43_23165 [Verrucomicrobiota bacterium]|nr:hypothetical protein [Verrucomicrobiota bacterium]
MNALRRTSWLTVALGINFLLQGADSDPAWPRPEWSRARPRDVAMDEKVLVVEQTWTAPGQGGADSAWGDLYGAVGIWCPLFSLDQQESAARRQALGETIWTYAALCQGEPTPWWHIDYPLLPGTRTRPPTREPALRWRL